MNDTFKNCRDRFHPTLHSSLSSKRKYTRSSRDKNSSSSKKSNSIEEDKKIQIVYEFLQLLVPIRTNSQESNNK